MINIILLVNDIMNGPLWKFVKQEVKWYCSKIYKKNDKLNFSS